MPPHDPQPFDLRSDGSTENRYRPVDVVIPVYNAPEAVERCLTSVLTNTEQATDPSVRVKVVDDASPDPAIATLLQRIGDQHPELDIEHRPQNLGFPGNCNLAMRSVPGDVVLLNSDTVVPHGWLEPLRRLAHSSPTVGSVTPLTNNGEICGVPTWLIENELPDWLTVDDLNQIAGMAGSGGWVELPTGVGFCQYFTRPALDAVGYFDAEAFERGYGEENDLCLRMRHHGFVSLLCDTVFVHHEGGESFGEAKARYVANNLRTLNRRWPGYERTIADYIGANPLAAVQSRFGFEVLRRSKPPDRPRVLHVLHKPIFAGNIGGTEFHVEDLVTHGQCDPVVLAGNDRSPLVQWPHLNRCRAFPAKASVRTDSTWVEAVLATGIDVVHLHHGLGYDVDNLLSLTRAAADRTIPVVCSLHDYYPVCPGVQLLDAETRQPCHRLSDPAAAGELVTGAEPADCVGCHQLSVDHLGAGVERWRQIWYSILDGATLIAPSEAAADNYRRAWGGIDHEVLVMPHGLDADRSPATPAPDPETAPPRPLHLGVIGYGGVHKGDDDLVALMAACRRAGLRSGDTDVVWHLFGRPRLEGAVEATVFHGSYARGEIVDLLRAAELDAVVALPTWAETYSYTLSEAWAAGHFVIAPDLGAIGDRIRRTGAGVLFDGTDPDDRAHQLLTVFGDPDRVGELRAAAVVAAADLPSVSDMVAGYDRLYRRLATVDGTGAPIPVREPNEWSVDELVSVVGGFRTPLPATACCTGGPNGLDGRGDPKEPHGPDEPRRLEVTS